MSFGWSAGDIMTAAELLWKIAKALDDTKGARDEFQQTTALLLPIQFQLRQLSNVLSQYEEDGATSINKDDGASMLEQIDADSFQGVLTRLKALFRQLEAELEEGCKMRLGNQKSGRIRDWPRDQFSKLKWSFVKEKKVQSLISQIQNLTETLPDLYRKIDR
jgi:hypothetical protein